MLGAGLAGVLCAGAASAATAADSDLPTVVVHYSDLSLGTDSGVNQLYRRIVYAAKRVCPDARDLSRQQQVQLCRDQAVAGAIEQIHNPRLAALHAAHARNG